MDHPGIGGAALTLDEEIDLCYHSMKGTVGTLLKRIESLRTATATASVAALESGSLKCKAELTTSLSGEHKRQQGDSGTEDVTTPPEDAVGFMRWARKDIVGYSVGDARRLSILQTLFANPETKGDAVDGALPVLEHHLGRLGSQLKNAKGLYDSVQKAGKNSKDTIECLQQAVQMLERKRDDFKKGLKALAQCACARKL